METSLHRELKRLYAGPTGRTEVRLGRYRVDAIVERDGREELIEIQHGPLSVIRDKIRQLCRRRRVRIVKPIVGQKRLIYCQDADGPVVRERKSPRRGQLLEIFDELVYFTRAFPHRNLSIDVVLVDIDEWRLPPDSRRSRRRGRWRPKYVVEDQKLRAVHQTIQLAKAADLRQLIGCALPNPFHTAQLADGLDVDRPTAQHIAYVLRNVGATVAVGKLRGAWLYRWCEPGVRQKAA